MESFVFSKSNLIYWCCSPTKFTTVKKYLLFCVENDVYFNFFIKNQRKTKLSLTRLTSDCVSMTMWWQFCFATLTFCLVFTLMNIRCVVRQPSCSFWLLNEARNVSQGKHCALLSPPPSSPSSSSLLLWRYDATGPITVSLRMITTTKQAKTNANECEEKPVLLYLALRTAQCVLWISMKKKKKKT